jgi:hypothetical protein
VTDNGRGPQWTAGLHKDRLPVKKLLTLIVASASLVLSTPAMAAPVGATPEAQARGLILVPLTLSKLEDLYFGTIIPSNLSGVVTVPADGTAPFASGGVTLVSSDPAFRARFAGAGSAGQQVIVTATNPVLLVNGLGNSVTVLALTLDGPPTRTIDPTRAFFFNVGGVLLVNANQPEGLYAAEFDVTASYL